ncbi:MAG: Rieske 2Fe-2S domain-containing protein [Pseudomonadota bacterium]|nr:Rieske 2Fe-2S domain-containing protein [Pseudomonadota bacterium]
MDRLVEQIPFGIGDLASCVAEDKDNGRFESSSRMYEDPLLFELEMKHIFEGTWIYLAHESQLPNPHDYYAARMGRHPILVTRNAGGRINAFLNTCPHRGAKLTGTKRGNKKSFMCPFHGWVFDSDGSCLDVRDQDRGAYPKYFQEQSHNLRALPKVDSYRGFIFASMNPDVDDLKTHLAGAADFIDLFADQSEDGLEVLRGEIKYTAKANWKMQQENIDGYHFFPTHLSYLGLIQRRVDQGGKDQVHAIDAREMGNNASGGNYDLGNGHMMDWAWMPNGDERPLGFQRDKITERHGPDRARWMIDHVRNTLIYPNLLLMDQSSTTLRMIHPISVDETLVEIYCVAPKNEPKAARTRRIRQYEDFLGPAGMASPDDQALFEICHRGLAGQGVEWLQGYSRGIDRILPGPDDEARKLALNPVASGTDIEDETLIHGAYRQWVKLMAAGLE